MSFRKRGAGKTNVAPTDSQSQASNIEMHSPERRDFVRKSVGAAAVISVSGALNGCVSAAKSERGPAGAQESKSDAASDVATSGPTNDDFDYIVIGSGAGGGPVACNLARHGHRVLLLEAGGMKPTMNYTVPAFHAASTEDPSLSWSFFVKHYQDQAQQAKDVKYVPGQGILYPRTGAVGGCTAHNAMITLYPDNQDWDDIADITGDSSWKHAGMRKYFQRVEKIGYSSPIGNPQQHGFNGWLSTEQTSPKFLFQEPTLRKIATTAAKEVGFENLINDVLENRNLMLDPNNMDYINHKTDGVFNIPKATYRGRRSGTRDYIARTRAEYPHNLILRTNALVNRILLDETNTRAIGVEYQEGENLYRAHASPAFFGGTTRQVHASREVILSGGAFNSPQILMLSGIGDRSEVESHGIPSRVHLPGVGKNLQDRYEIGVNTKLNHDIGLIANCTFGKDPDPCLTGYLVNPTAFVYSTNGVTISILKKSSPDKKSPDLAIFATPGKFTGYFPGWSTDAVRKNYFTWSILKGHTRNTAGTVTLKSADPRDTPDINFRYFDEGNDQSGDDMAAMLEGYATVQRMNAQKTIAAISEDLTSSTQTKEQFTQHLKNNAWGHHASCSNKMGPKSDPMAVVDSKFRVHGIDGLRIVDASVFPKIPGLFIVVPIYMIAEKASEDILAGT